MEERNTFEDFINSLEQLDQFQGEAEEAREIVQNDPIQIFIDQLGQIYGIDFSGSSRQFLVELIKLAEEISPGISDIISQFGYNTLLLNETWLYRARKKTMNDMIFQIFLYGIAFGRLYKG